jgi:hypothetical protein
VKPADELVVLQAFYRDKLALVGRHEAGAQRVGQYDVNNTYQYIIGREQAQVSWLEAAIAALGGPIPEPQAAPEPPVAVPDILRDDAARMRQFVERWREPVAQVTNARNKGMLRVILGESLEHERFFEQAAAGRLDLLGRRTAGAARRGVVLPTRWVGPD